MIYLFDEQGRCKLRTSGDMPKEVLQQNMDSVGAKTYIVSEELFELRDCCLIDGKISGRGPNPAIMDGLWVRRVPHKATLTIDDGVDKQTHEVTDSDVELDFEFPGTYKVTISKFPYLDITYEVTV